MESSMFVGACEIFSCGMRDLVPWSGTEPRPPALGARYLSHWTTREVPPVFVFSSCIQSSFSSLASPLSLPPHSFSSFLLFFFHHWIYFRGRVVTSNLIIFIHFFLRVCLLSCFSHVWLFVTPWIVAHQAPLSMEFSRQEHWNGLPFPIPEGLPPLRDWTCISCISCVGRQIFLLLQHLGSLWSRMLKKWGATVTNT